MARVTLETLEEKVKDIKSWLDNHHELHPQKAQKKQAFEYYIAKMVEMDENDLKTIEID